MIKLGKVILIMIMVVATLILQGQADTRVSVKKVDEFTNMLKKKTKFTSILAIQKVIIH